MDDPAKKEALADMYKGIWASGRGSQTKDGCAESDKRINSSGPYLA